MPEKVHVDLHGAAQTMLTTLYCKARDTDLPRPVLDDRYAKQVTARIDYDWPGLCVADRWTPLVTVRAALFDSWAAQFLAAHRRATVIHLGCGLDSRVLRLDPGADVEWYDVDQPEVIALRDKVFPAPSRHRHYHPMAASAAGTAWLDDVPAGRPTLLLAEGISMYLTEADGVALLQRVVDRFGGDQPGELQIDFYNWLGVRSQKTHRLQRQSGSTLHWAVNAPGDVLQKVHGVRLLAASTFFDAPTFARVPGGLRRTGRLARAIPPLRTMFGYHRYAFGPAG